MVRLEPMSNDDFRRSIERSIPRYADELVTRGRASPASALARSRSDFAELLPQGLATPGYQFRHVVDEPTGERVGETWYTVRSRGPVVDFWVDWIWIEPPHRRRGLATATLRRLEEEAVRLGAVEVGLNVFADNPGAMRLYEKLGYAPMSFHLLKRLGPPP